MNKAIKKISINVLFVYLLISCSGNPKSELDQISGFINQYPDSALSRLDALIIDEQDESDHYRCLLYKVQARDLAYKPIRWDFTIFDCYNYFQIQGLKYYESLSSFYCGRVLQKNGIFDDALKYYHITETYSRKNRLENLLALSLYSSAEILFNQLLYDDAKEMLSEAISIFENIDNREYLIKSHILIGRCFNSTQHYEDALYHLNKGHTLALKDQNKEKQALASLSIGYTYHEKGDYGKAIEYYLGLENKDSIVYESGRILIYTAKSYLSLNQIDSAYYYAKNSIKFARKDSLMDPCALSKAYNMLSLIEEKRGNYIESMKYARLYADNMYRIAEKNKSTAIAVTERIYKYDQTKKENEILAEKQRKSIMLIMGGLLVSISTLFIFQRKLLNKTRQLNKLSQDNECLNIEIVSLTEDLKEFYNKKDFMRSNLNKTLSLFRRAAYIESLVQDTTNNKQGKVLIKLFNEIAYGEEYPVWDILFQILDTVHYGIFSKLKEDYVSLDETEFKICCLIQSQFTSNEIAVITRLSINTVHSKTTIIRKKLGIKKFGNITEFINKQYGQSSNNS